MKPNFTAIDLFAGIGGFRLAVEKCGGHTIAFSEINSDAIDAYTRNYQASIETNLGDITRLDDLPPHDLLTGGVPCQSWSIAGKNLGFDDDRGQLWNDALFLLKKSRPKAFIFENVKGLADPRNNEALNYIMNRIKDAGYFATYYVLNSFDYGVPQSRVRIYIIGFLNAYYHKLFRLPEKTNSRLKLKDVIDGEIIYVSDSDIGENNRGLFDDFGVSNAGGSSLSNNNNGHNDYFLFNDLRNGNTTIHTWDILSTTERQKHICLLLLRNRRKRNYGPLDGNPLSLEHFKSLDSTISANELSELVAMNILKEEKYSYSVIRGCDSSLSFDEQFVLSKHESNLIIPDNLVSDRNFKKSRINILETLNSLEEKGYLKCNETRFDFRHAKISTGLFGINRIFLPSSNIFPTLVASDSNDFVTPVSITATNAEKYKSDFIKYVFEQKQYRKISKTEALRIQGFPENFQMPDTRSRWMKLIGNSVSVAVIEKLVNAIIETGVFNTPYKDCALAASTIGNDDLSQQNRIIDLNHPTSSEHNFMQMDLFSLR